VDGKTGSRRSKEAEGKSVEGGGGIGGDGGRTKMVRWEGWRRRNLVLAVDQGRKRRWCWGHSGMEMPYIIAFYRVKKEQEGGCTRRMSNDRLDLDPRCYVDHRLRAPSWWS